MTVKKGLVSVIIPFYHVSPAFFREAIESVLNQTYQNFELLLIDDGADEESAAVADEYARMHPERIRVYCHPGGGNRGISASRQLGIANAGGEFIAFLDADDVWLENKLDEQVALLEQHPEAGMLYGNTLYWYSWTGKDADLHRDYLPVLGLETKGVIQPPKLLPLYLLGKTVVPCTCSLLIRKQALEAVGGFEAAFAGMYEDQVFYAKISLQAPIYVSGACWDKYRQHPVSMTAVSAVTGEEQIARGKYLEWLENYLIEKGIKDPEVWTALKKALWLYRKPEFHRMDGRIARIYRRFKKWLLKVEEWILPASVSQFLWTLGQKGRS